MCGHVRPEYFLPRIFGSQIFLSQITLSDQIIPLPKMLWTLTYVGIKRIGTYIFGPIFSWHQNLAQLKSRVWTSSSAC